VSTDKSTNLLIKIKNFRVIKQAEIDLSRKGVIFYGPNGSGKSTAIHSLLGLFGSRDSLDDLDGELYLKYGDDHIRVYREVQLMLDAKVGGYEEKRMPFDDPRALDAIRLFWNKIGVRRIAHIEGDILKIYDLYRTIPGFEPDLQLDINDKDSWRRVMSQPQLLFEEINGRFLLNYIRDLVDSDIDILYIIIRLAVDTDTQKYKWVEWTKLAYGYRRAAMMMIGLLADVILIEGFDNGLHIDLGLEILNSYEKVLGGSNRFVVIETHIGSLITRKIRTWDIYYFDRGVVKKISEKDLSYIELFKRELEAYKQYFSTQ